MLFVQCNGASQVENQGVKKGMQDEEDTGNICFV